MIQLAVDVHGFSVITTGKQIVPLNSYFGSVAGQAVFGGVQCVGNEATLLDCPYNTSTQCTSLQQAGVLCPGNNKVNEKDF